MTENPTPCTGGHDVGDGHRMAPRWLEGYRTIEGLAGTMAEAAARGDWPRFERAHRDVERTIASLPAAEPDEPDALTPVERRTRFAILARILAHDAKIRDTIEPWSPSIDVWLGRRPFGTLDRRSR
ncbi:MAG: flagellar protein FliT [Burkholderiales bacterium]|nr:flagellar protein FliT [Burkholderiales bacterium]